MRVTGIETTKKGRYALMVDGEFAFSLHRDTFLLCPWLQKGAEVSPERLETLRQEDELRSARERALDLLSAAEQTSGTLRQKLLRWYGEEAVEAAVLRMEELGLINDLDYGRRYAADAVNLRGWPRRRIAMELQKKGVPAEVIEEVQRYHGGDGDRNGLPFAGEAVPRKAAGPQGAGQGESRPAAPGVLLRGDTAGGEPDIGSSAGGRRNAGAGGNAGNRGWAGGAACPHPEEICEEHD